ncbi:MAG TPA: zinc dependent phospholipase C family protein [Desulfobacterales bacterium]|nr:zinc dependent phospholipase C family protein [Desulfobacterales bacterium]
MPSHFTHLIFAEESLAGALGDEATPILRTHGNLLRFAAQGPDIFYHNQRTMPTGLRFGVALHKHGYGSMVGEMVREALRLGMGPATELGSYVLGFATHAILDRHTHPYIIHFAGWDEGGRQGDNRAYHTHPFLERILDLLVLGERRGLEPSRFDFLPLVRLAHGLPYPVLKALVKGLHAIYPTFARKSLDRARIENAYHDTVFFYKLTNHLNAELPHMAWKKDRKDGFRQRRLGLLHPREVPPGVDFLNRERRPWCHPCDDTAVSHEGFLDLYARALDESVRTVTILQAALSGRASIEDAAAAVSDLSLDTGRDPCTPRFSNPFPLREILDAEYRRLEASPGR